jgi:hypothetical protein
MVDRSAFDIIGQYYVRPAAPDLLPGRICDAVVYYLPPGTLEVLTFDFDAANRGQPVQYTVGPVRDDTFDH